MRVLYFSRDYTTHDRRFLLKLAQSCHDVYFLRLEDDGIAYETRVLPKSIRAVEWRGGRKPLKMPEDWLRLMPDFCSVLDCIKPDLVHAGPVQSCGFMTALSGFHPFLLMSWGSDLLIDAHQNEFWRWMTKYALDRSDYLLCDCRAVKNQAKEIIHYPEGRICQSSYGVDLAEFAPGRDRLRLKERLGWKNNFVVLSTRTWEPIYGVDVLLKAFKQAHAQNPKLRLILLGGGSRAGTFRDFIQKHDLKKAVFQPGMVSHEQLPDYFKAADLYMSCSYSDGTSVSLLEATATGLPVIVTDHAGNKEWLKPGKNGWLAQAGNSKEFAKLLLHASRMTPAERSKMSWGNRQKAEKFANWDVNFSKLMDFYERIETRFKKRK